MFWRRKKKRSRLDKIIAYWCPGEPYRWRQLMDGGAVCFGRAGGGKSSGFGKWLAEAIVAQPDSAMLILAAKPEDRDEWAERFDRAGKPLVIFEEGGPYRCNFLSQVGKGDPRFVVKFFSALEEAVSRSSGGADDDGGFWRIQRERLLYCAVSALQIGGEEVTAPNLHTFIIGAATTAAQINDQNWGKTYHPQVLKKGFHAPKAYRQQQDYQLALDFWTGEWPVMAEKTRTSILAHAMGLLSVYNTGLVAEMVSGATNVSPLNIVSDGVSVLVNFPPPMYGPSGTLIDVGWKYLTELSVLQREARDESPFVAIWCDEYSQFCNRFDADYICQCRSHRGCLVSLLQSVASIYAAMPGEHGRHFADALLANYSHAVVFPADPVTAKWAASKLGHELKLMVGGSRNPHPKETVYDELFGCGGPSFSWSHQMLPVLDEGDFMVGRTGGPMNDFICDAWALKSGEPFANGRQYLRVAFSQRG